MAEHHATIDSVEWLAAHEGAILDWIEVDELGRIRLGALEAALAVGGDEVALVTAIWANNEVGTIQPVAEIVEVADALRRSGAPRRDRRVRLDPDRLPRLRLRRLRSRGALDLRPQDRRSGRHRRARSSRRSTTVEPLLHGGNQQRARSGTQDAAGAVAFGVAAELAAAELPEHAARLASLRDRLVAGIRSTVPGAVLRGRSGCRRPPSRQRALHLRRAARATRCCSCSTRRASRCRPAPPARPGCRRPRTCCSRWACRSRTRAAPCASPSGTTPPHADVDALLAALPGVVTQARTAGLAARTPTLGR